MLDNQKFRIHTLEPLQKLFILPSNIGTNKSDSRTNRLNSPITAKSSMLLYEQGIKLPCNCRNI